MIPQLDISVALVHEPARVIDKGIEDQLDSLERSLLSISTDKRKSYCWLATVGDEVAGYACMEKRGTWGLLSSAGVLKRFRRLGVHKMLIQSRIEKARELGWRYVATYTDKSNHQSANNLIRQGFLLYQPRSLYGCMGALYLKHEFNKWGGSK